MRVRRGIAEYPGYYCYDAGRPSWLPYFIDSLTESKCKYTPSTIAGNITACLGNSPQCQNPSQAQQNPDLSGPGVAPAGTPSNTPSCTGFSVFNAATGACEFDPTNPLLLALVVGGVAFAAFAYSAGGRR